MASTWFTVDRTNGGVSALPKAPKAASRRKWKERTMESVLGLNPELIGAGKCFPVALQGAQSGPDQLYIDELGRLTVVEVKARSASEADLIQVLGYAYNCPAYAPEQHTRSFQTLMDRAPMEFGVRVLAVTHPELRSSPLEMDLVSSFRAAAGKLKLPAGQPTVQELGDAALRRLGYDPLRGETLQAAGQRRWGNHAFDLIRMSPRIVLVAPSFSDSCTELAHRLVERWVDLHLVRLDIFDAGKNQILVEREDVAGRSQMGRVWTGLTELWRDADVRASYRPSGWYMYKKSRDAMLNLSALQAPGVELGLLVCEDESEGYVFFRIAHSTYEDPKERERLRKELERRFPKASKREGGDFLWTFPLPKKNAQWIECARTVAKVGVEVLRV